MATDAAMQGVALRFRWIFCTIFTPCSIKHRIHGVAPGGQWNGFGAVRRRDFQRLRPSRRSVLKPTSCEHVLSDLEDSLPFQRNRGVARKYRRSPVEIPICRAECGVADGVCRHVAERGVWAEIAGEEEDSRGNRRTASTGRSL